MPAKGQVDAPVGSQIADARLVVETIKIGGPVGEGGMEAVALSGKIPFVFGVEVGTGMIRDVMVVVDGRGVVACRQQLSVVVEIIPSHTRPYVVAV